jgi:hypothetical protein
VEWNPPNLFFISRNSEKKMAASQRPLTQQLLAPVPSRLCRANQTEPAGWEILRAEGQMDGVKALVVLASKVKVLSSSVIKLLRMELSVKFTVIQRCNAHGTLN